MSITVSLASSSAKAQAYIIPVTSGEVSKGLGKEITSIVATKDLFKVTKFKGNLGQNCFHIVDGKTPVVFVGLGKLDKTADENREALRRAIGSGYTALTSSAKDKVVLFLTNHKSYGVTRAVLVEQVTTLLYVASYRFVEYKKREECLGANNLACWWVKSRY